MNSSELENLARAGRLKREPFLESEFRGLLESGSIRLQDAQNSELALESRFDLAYNASHSIALAALRYRGFRADSRYIVFQVLPHTLGLPPEVWRGFALAHERRNRSEDEGLLNLDERLVADVIEAAKQVQEELRALLLPKESSEGD